MENKNSIAVWGLVLTALTVLISFVTYQSTNERENERLELERNEKRIQTMKDSIALVEETEKRIKAYQDELKQFERLNKNLSSGEPDFTSIRMETNSNEGLRICIYYYALADQWVTEGHFFVKKDEPLFLNNITTNNTIFISLECNCGREFTNRDVTINGINISESTYYSKKIRPIEGFTILERYPFPFETVNRKFFMLKAMNLFGQKHIQVHIDAPTKLEGCCPSRT